MEMCLKYNFGMICFEGYCKVVCIMEMVDCFGLLFVSFVDILGVYLGCGVEECGQFEVIVCFIDVGFGFGIVFVVIVIGEGGFGGVIVIVLVNKVLMMEYVIYLVILLEGVVLILWCDSVKVQDVVIVFKIIVQDFKQFGVIDEIVLEFVGGVYCVWEIVIDVVGSVIEVELKVLMGLSVDQFCKQWCEKFIVIGWMLI